MRRPLLRLTLTRNLRLWPIRSVCYRTKQRCIPTVICPSSSSPSSSSLGSTPRLRSPSPGRPSLCSTNQRTNDATRPVHETGETLKIRPQGPRRSRTRPPWSLAVPSLDPRRAFSIQTLPPERPRRCRERVRLLPAPRFTPCRSIQRRPAGREDTTKREGSTPPTGALGSPEDGRGPPRRSSIGTEENSLATAGNVESRGLSLDVTVVAWRSSLQTSPPPGLGPMRRNGNGKRGWRSEAEAGSGHGQERGRERPGARRRRRSGP